MLRLERYFFLLLLPWLLISCNNPRWVNQNTMQEDLAFTRLLESRDPEAMFQMGYFHFSRPGLVRYSNGKPVAPEDRNYGGALKWFERAAKTGHIGAMLQTALLYNQGMGVVAKNPSAALYWYQRAFDSGEREHSPYWLGDLHMRGEGGATQDFKKAFYYFNQSYGSYPLEKLLLRTENSVDEIPKDTRFCVYGAHGLRRVSLFYRCGWGVDMDVEKADRIISNCAKYLDNPWCKRDDKRDPPPCILPKVKEKFDD